MKTETNAIHAGHEIDPSTGAVMPQITLSTTFERDKDGEYSRKYFYNRIGNPNRTALETRLSTLEGGTATACFASGSTAGFSVLQALSPKDHVVAPDDIYFGIRAIMKEIMTRWGLQFTFVDMTDLDAVRAAVQPNTKLIWTETPSNPQLKVTDLAAIAEITQAADAFSLCDNTWATPIFQRPFEHGIDIVMHSTTKYIGGHSDVLGGSITVKEESPLFERIRFFQEIAGAVPSPFDCWLLLRSLTTLKYRVEGHAANAMQIAQFLAEHPNVERVHYPGLVSDPGHAVAKKQMDQFGGMLSVQIKGGAEAAMAVVAKVELFTRATSLGGVESLIEHRASVEGPDSPTPPSLLRVSIGLENTDDLIADLAQALG